MNIGMLWWIDTPKDSFPSNVEKAIAHYKKKYGHDPNLCFVNPSDVMEGMELPSIAIRPYLPVLPGHLWIGVEDHEA